MNIAVIPSEMNTASDKVPQRPLAKLMFYLRTVSRCVDIKELCDLPRWADFSHYHLLTNREADDVACLCLSLSPDNLRHKCLSECDSKAMNMDNVFYDTELAKSQGLQVSDVVAVNGSYLRIKGVMTCKAEWLEEFYYTPIKHYEHVMEGAKMTLRIRSCSPRLIQTSQTTYGTFSTVGCV